MAARGLPLVLLLAALAPGKGNTLRADSPATCDSAAPLPRSIPVDSVDVKPEVVPPHPHLVTPPRLARAGLTDNVLLEYDVDSMGVVDRCSIRILLAKRPEFAASASAYVEGLHFTPGLNDGVPVRTRIEQHILFWQTNGARGKHHIF